MTASSPMSVQGQPAVIVTATTQTPKAIIPAEIRIESTVSMIGPPFLRAKVGPPGNREIKRPAAPAAQNRPATRGSQAAYRTRPKANERSGPELQGVRIYLMGRIHQNREAT
jgi:hypothetical protein